MKSFAIIGISWIQLILYYDLGIPQKHLINAYLNFEQANRLEFICNMIRIFNLIVIFSQKFDLPHIVENLNFKLGAFPYLIYVNSLFFIDVQ